MSLVQVVDGLTLRAAVLQAVGMRGEKICSQPGREMVGAIRKSECISEEMGEQSWRVQPWGLAVVGAGNMNKTQQTDGQP